MAAPFLAQSNRRLPDGPLFLPGLGDRDLREIELEGMQRGSWASLSAPQEGTPDGVASAVGSTSLEVPSTHNSPETPPPGRARGRAGRNSPDGVWEELKRRQRADRQAERRELAQSYREKGFKPKSCPHARAVVMGTCGHGHARVIATPCNARDCAYCGPRGRDAIARRITHGVQTLWGLSPDVNVAWLVLTFPDDVEKEVAVDKLGRFVDWLRRENTRDPVESGINNLWHSALPRGQPLTPWVHTCTRVRRVRDAWVPGADAPSRWEPTRSVVKRRRLPTGCDLTWAEYCATYEVTRRKRLHINLLMGPWSYVHQSILVAKWSAILGVPLAIVEVRQVKSAEAMGKEAAKAIHDDRLGRNVEWADGGGRHVQGRHKLGDYLSKIEQSVSEDRRVSFSHGWPAAEEYKPERFGEVAWERMSPDDAMTFETERKLGEWVFSDGEYSRPRGRPGAETCECFEWERAVRIREKLERMRRLGFPTRATTNLHERCIQ